MKACGEMPAADTFSDPVVGHQAVRQHPDPRLTLDRLFQDPLERVVIVCILKDRHPAITTVQHVVDIAPEIDVSGSSHGKKRNSPAFFHRIGS